MTKRQRRQLDKKGTKRRLRRPGYVKQSSRLEKGSARAKQRARRQGNDLAALEAEVMAGRE